MSSICMNTRQWANESAKQTPATHNFIHFKMYWYTQCHVPTNFSPLEPQASQTGARVKTHLTIRSLDSLEETVVSRSRKLLLKLL